MLYLVFGMLLLLGAIVSGAYLYISHKKNQVSATVLLSSCGIKREGEKIESISVSHTLEIEGEEKKKIVTDKIPVQELNGAVLTLQYDEATGEVVSSENTQYFPFVCGFALSGVLQLYKQSRFFYNNQLRAVWEKHRGLLELNEKAVCIVGCGSGGTER